VAATILTNVTDDMKVVADEQFGPLLPVIPFDDIDDAIAAANATEYGLCGSIWTSDIAKGAELAARLECGTTLVNSHAEVATAHPLWRSQELRHRPRWWPKRYRRLRGTADPVRLQVAGTSAAVVPECWPGAASAVAALSGRHRRATCRRRSWSPSTTSTTLTCSTSTRCARAVGVPAAVPILRCDARRRDSVKAILVSLIEEVRLQWSVIFVGGHEQQALGAAETGVAASRRPR